MASDLKMEGVLMTMKGKEIILGILKDSSHTGYEINDILQERLNHFFDGTFGMIYPTLKKLEHDGLVTKQQITQHDKPNKNVYAITKQGENVFLEALIKPTTDDVLKSDFLMRMYFSDYLDAQTIKQFIEEEIARKQSKLSKLESQLDGWRKQGMSDTKKITVDYGIAHYSATLQILRKALEEYE
ncbi:PadR family transcriptional regulator [Leuconostoc fallax]|uniref:Transcription regulator PadR N-terminal domain-containing protein n=2 Tax=Leuconostoc fallax TaxID=1251 RepID=A0A4R5N6Q5_9LACO|nr:PadR family transcriptional regulator [Leuconostoc fallax]TDG67485.1 hypothetical protein C5L23_001284 [Leuconostoc fallax]